MAVNQLKLIDPNMFGIQSTSSRVKMWLEQASENAEFSSTSILRALGLPADQLGAVSGALTNARRCGWIVATGQDVKTYLYRIGDRSLAWGTSEIKPERGERSGPRGDYVRDVVFQDPEMPKELIFPDPNAGSVDVASIGAQMLELIIKLDGYRPPRTSLTEYTDEELLTELLRRKK